MGFTPSELASGSLGASVNIVVPSSHTWHIAQFSISTSDANTSYQITVNGRVVAKCTKHSLAVWNCASDSAPGDTDFDAVSAGSLKNIMVSATKVINIIRTAGSGTGAYYISGHDIT